MQKTIKSILEEMKVAVENQTIISPTKWIDWALELSTLWQDLKVELTKAEILYAQEMVKLLEKEMPKGKAEIIIKAQQGEEGKMSVYEKYKYLVGRDKLVEQFIMLAKRRATIENI